MAFDIQAQPRTAIGRDRALPIGHEFLRRSEYEIAVLKDTPELFSTLYDNGDVFPTAEDYAVGINNSGMFQNFSGIAGVNVQRAQYDPYGDSTFGTGVQMYPTARRKSLRLTGRGLYFQSTDPGGRGFVGANISEYDQRPAIGRNTLGMAYEMWVAFNDYRDGQADYILHQGSLDYDTLYEYQYLTYSLRFWTDNRLRFEFVTRDGPAAISYTRHVLTSIDPVVRGVPMHIVMSYDTQTAKFFINGVLQASETYPGVLNHQVRGNLADYETIPNWETTANWDFDIANVAIYPHGLTTQQILDHYSAAMGSAVAERLLLTSSIDVATAMTVYETRPQFIDLASSTSVETAMDFEPKVGLPPSGGRYPSTPGPRIPYDRNGSSVFSITTAGVPTEISPVTVGRLNSAQILVPAGSDGGLVPLGQYVSLVVIFSNLQDITGFFYAWSQYFGSSTVAVSYSKDTTNGFDGTWISINPSYPYLDLQVRPNYRTSITRLPSTLTSVRAFRVTNPAFFNGVRNNASALHIYGTPTVTNGLEFWHPTSDASLNLTPGWFDFLDVARNTGQSITKAVRIKNRATQTAIAPVISLEAIYDTTPTVLSQMALLNPAGTVVPTITLPDLAPGAVSQPFSVRYTPAANAAVSSWEQRLLADATSWS